jgi:hypothetical protein
LRPRVADSTSRRSCVVTGTDDLRRAFHVRAIFSRHVSSNAGRNSAAKALPDLRIASWGGRAQKGDKMRSRCCSSTLWTRSSPTAELSLERAGHGLEDPQHAPVACERPNLGTLRFGRDHPDVE